jgi:hypothetical protein
MTTYDLVPATDYANRIIRGNLDIAQTTSFNVRQLAVGTHAVGQDVVILCDATAGNVTLNLPLVSGALRRFYIIKKTNITNTLTIFPAVGNTINGSGSYSYMTDMSIEIVNDGSTDWLILTNTQASLSPTDAGVATRELLNASGGAQNPSVSVTCTEVNLVNNANGVLPNGVLGQLKEVMLVNMVIPGTSYTLTLGNPVGQNTFIFNTVGQSLSFRYTAYGWTFTNSGADTP